MAITTEVLKGTMDLLVLKALLWGPQHGYGILKWVRQTTEGGIALEEGGLYPALHRMERKGWIAAEWGVSENNRRAKYYELTRAGRAQLNRELRSWARVAEAVWKIANATA